MSALANAQLHYVIPGSFKKKKQNVYWAHLDGPKPSSRDLVRGAEALNLPSPSSWDTGLATLVDSTSHAPIYEIRRPPPTARAAKRKEVLLNLEDQLQAKTNEQSSIHCQLAKIIDEQASLRIEIDELKAEVENLKADMKDTLEMVKVQKETLEVILNFLQQDMEKKFIFPNFRRSKIFCLH